LLCLPLAVMAQPVDSAHYNFLDRIDQQVGNGSGGNKTSEFANKEFVTGTFKTGILNQKSANLMRNNDNFNYSNSTFNKQFATDSFNGFGGRFTAPANRNFSTDKIFDPGARPFNGQTLSYRMDRDNKKTFTAADWDKRYYREKKIYEGKEMTQLSASSGTVLVQNKDDVKWKQESLSSEQIKEILNKNK
jgi:hypothetical protein